MCAFAAETLLAARASLLSFIVHVLSLERELYMDLASITSLASETLLQHGSHLPTLLIEFEGRRAPLRSSLRFFPSKAEQKEEFLYWRGRRMARQHGHRTVRHVWLVMEAWMNRPEPGMPSVAPSLDPRREEVLLVLELNARDFSQAFEGRKMIRNQAGKLIDLQPLKETMPEADDLQVTGTLLLAFLAGFVEGAPAYQGTNRRGEILAHIASQKLRMAGFITDDPSS